MKYFYYFKIKNKFIERLFVLFIFLGAGAINTSIAKTASTDVISIEMAAQLSKSISIEVKQSSMRKILYEIQKQTKLNIIIEDNDIDNLPKIDFKVKDMTVGEVLSKLTYGTPYSYQVINNSIAIAKRPTTLTAQQNRKINITGKVVNAKDNAEIVGATIIAEKSGAGAISDAKGAFSLELNSADIIEVSYIGYISQTITVNSSINNLVVKLVSDDMIVDDVVVTGYFNKQKETYTGAVTTFTGSELRAISTGNVLSSLSMLDPSFVQVEDNEMGSDPNTVPNFEIRGSSSIKGQYEGNPNMPTFIMDGFEVEATKIYDLDRNRIKSITILKDASATAIYGSRAANGVVVIETVAPAAGKLRVTYSGNLDLEVADLSSYNLMNAAQKLEYERLSGLFDGSSSRPDAIEAGEYLYNDRLKLVVSGVDTEWYKIPVKDVGVGHKHNVTVEGGDESFRYNVDLYYSDKEGVLKGSYRESYGGAVKLQYNTKKVKFSNYTSFDNIKGVNSPYGTYSDYTTVNPYYYPYDDDGNISPILYTYRDYHMNYIEVPNYLYDSILPSKDESVSNNFLNNFSLEYNITEGLMLKANLSVGVDNYNYDKYLSNQHSSFISTYSTLPAEETGSYDMTVSKTFSYDANITLSYFKEIKKHAINAGFIYNVTESNEDAISISAIGFPNLNLDHISMASSYTENSSPSGDYNVTRLIGIAANLGYSYDNKYLLDLSLRSDGSSMFGANNRWGTFWSVGAGWNIHKEDFMKDNSLFSLLKMRASIGSTGAQSFSPYQAMTTLSYSSSDTYDGRLGATIISYGNEDLKWQVTNKRNIGLDFEVLNRRLSGTINYYNDETEDTLIDVTTAPSTGFTSYKENLGVVRNSGYEISLKGTILRNLNKNMSLSIMVNAVHNKNQVLEISDALTAFNEEQDENVENKPTVRYQEGMSMNTIWANESLGIDTATGYEVFLDKDGNVTDEWSVDNYKALGCTDPDLYGNISAMFSYKSFEFNASFYYKFGGQTYNQTLVDKIENVNPNLNGDLRILTDRWNEPGDEAMFKNVAASTNTYPTSRFIEDENYIKLQSLSFAYYINSKKLQEMGIERVKISAIGNDIFTASTVKMERGTYYPYARTFSLALQFTF